MSRTTEKSRAAEKAAQPSPFGFGFGALPNGSSDVFTTWMAVNQTMLAGFSKMQEEAGRFLTRRLQDDLERQQELMACSTPEQMWQVYQTFVQQMMTDYAEEAKRQAEIAGEMQTSCTRAGATIAEAATPPGKPAAAAE